MKKLFALLALFILSVPLFAQDDSLAVFSFESEPLRSESTPYFSIGAGYTYSFLFMNYDKLNDYVNGKLGLDNFSGPFYLSGVHGFTGIVIIPNMRLGFFGISGTKLVEKDITAGASTTKRTSELYVGLNGFSLDYGYVPFKNFAILPGVNFGWGSFELTSYETPSAIDWTSVDKIDVAGTSMNRIENSIMFVEPQINIEYAITNFSMVRLQLGYNYTFDSPLANKKWMLNNNAELKGVPSGMNSNGLKASLGLYLGLFNY